MTPIETDNTDDTPAVPETLDEQLARLERERARADRAYNDALTALDRAVARAPEPPHPPPPYDASRLPDLAREADVLAAGPPVIDRSIKGRLRGLIWRIVGPPLESQRRFNAALVDHLGRNAAAHEEAQKAITTALAQAQGQLADLVRFESHLIQYLQTITLFVDTRDRAAAGGALVLNAALGAITDDWLKRWESLGAREQRLGHRVESVLASLDDLKASTALAQQTALSLKREVERLFAAARAAASGRAPDDAPAEAAAPETVDSVGARCRRPLARGLQVPGLRERVPRRAGRDPAPAARPTCRSSRDSRTCSTSGAGAGSSWTSSGRGASGHGAST